MGKCRRKKKSKICTYLGRDKENTSSVSITEESVSKICNKDSKVGMIGSTHLCRLCCKEPADRKGSHIVPHFLLKRVINVEGKTQRDYEIGFRLDNMGMSSYFGRAVQPEKLEAIYGEISDEDIAKNQPQLVVDNYYCSECEKRLSLIENAYSKTLNKTGIQVYESGVTTILGLLFWGSVVWRISNHGKSGVNLKPEQEKLLGNILDKYLPKRDIQELNNIDFSNIEDLSKISYKLIRFIGLEENDSKFLFVDPEYDNCFVLFIDEFIVVFTFDKNYGNFGKKSKLELEKLFESVEESELDGNEKIYPFVKDAYINICKKLIDIAKDQYYAGISTFCDTIHRELGGEGDTMPPEIKNEIFQELALIPTELGRKYTQENLVCSVMRVLQNHCKS